MHCVVETGGFEHEIEVLIEEPAPGTELRTVGRRCGRALRFSHAAEMAGGALRFRPWRVEFPGGAWSSRRRAEIPCDASRFRARSGPWCDGALRFAACG